MRYVRPAVIIFLCSLGLAGPTWPCWASNGAGNSFTSLYSSLILTDRRIRVLMTSKDEPGSRCSAAETHLFSSSFMLSSGYEANTSHVRFPDVFNSGFNGGNVDSISEEVATNTFTNRCLALVTLVVSFPQKLGQGGAKMVRNRTRGWWFRAASNSRRRYSRRRALLRRDPENPFSCTWSSSVERHARFNLLRFV